MKPYLHLLDRSLARTQHDADVFPLARATVQVLRDDLAELDAARARVAELEKVERAAQAYVMAGLCGNPDTSAELAALIEVARTDR